MKKLIFKMTGILVLAIIAAAQVARAQEPVIVNIPFDFTASDQTLPAGEYLVQKLADGSPALLIRRTDRTAGMMVNSFAAVARDPQTDSKLIFNRYGHRYFLSQVWSAGSSRGSQLMKSAAEKELALSARIETPNQVTLVARLMTPKR